jgi:hypothetical protein
MFSSFSACICFYRCDHSLFIHLEMGPHSVAQAGLRFLGSSDPPDPAFPIAGTTGIPHRARFSYNSHAILLPFSYNTAYFVQF